MGDFLWGVATAASQVEGGIEQTDWQVFITDPGIARRVNALLRLGGTESVPSLEPAGDAISHGDLEVLRADLDRARLLGLNAYRFSIEWARIEPQPGRFRDDVVEGYYVKVAEELRRRNMEPILTLQHLSLPAWVLTPPSKTRWAGPLPVASARDGGFQRSLKGWESAATVNAFIRFVERVVPRLRDAGVRYWIPINEPTGSVIALGYLAGIWPPGFTLAGRRARAAYLNLLRAHVRAYDAIKAVDAGAMVGIAHAMSPARPWRRRGPWARADEAASAQTDYFLHQHFLDSVLLGHVDIRIDRRPRRRKLVAAQEFFDLGRVDWKPRLDFVGVNYYRPLIIRFHPLFAALAGYCGGLLTNRPGRAESRPVLDDAGVRVEPRGLAEVVRKVHETYRLPILVTENGVRDRSDLLRGAYIVSHLESLRQAAADGAHVLGYIHWTLADNWEWHEGYQPGTHLGLFMVDRNAEGRPRALSPGALALRHIALGGDLEEAKARYGFITDDGTQVGLPVRSPGALWIAPDGEGGELAVYLTRLAGDAPTQVGSTAIVFDPRIGHWMALEQTEWRLADISTTKITAVTTRSQMQVELGRAWFDGIWLVDGDTPFGAIQLSGLSRWEVPRGGRRWMGKTHDGTRWQGCTGVEVMERRVILTYAPGAPAEVFDLDLNGEQVRFVSAGSGLIARRLPDHVVEN